MSNKKTIICSGNIVAPLPRIHGVATVDPAVIKEAVSKSELITVTKRVAVFGVLTKLTIDNAIKVTELISKIKELFSDDPETLEIVINVIMSVAN